MAGVEKDGLIPRSCAIYILLMTLANAVTALRLLLIPLVFWLLSLQLREAALGVVFAFFLGDVLDGHLARTRQEVTALGKFLDPLADKLLAFGLLLWFAAQGEISWWPAGLLLLQNTLLLAGSLKLCAQGKSTIPARWSGKAAAIVLGMGLVSVFVRLSFAEALLWIGVLAAYGALLDYARVARLPR